MKHVFYAMTLLFIIWEMVSLYHFKTMKQKIKEVSDKSKIALQGDENGLEQYIFLYIIIVFFLFGYLVWGLVGLFTFQWPVFLLLFLIGLIPKKDGFIRLVDSAVSIAILLFIVLNAYHFNIDVWAFIKGLL